MKILAFGCRKARQNNWDNTIKYMESLNYFDYISISPRLSDFSKDELTGLQKKYSNYKNLIFEFDQDDSLKSINKIIPAVKRFGFDNNYYLIDDDINFLTDEMKKVYEKSLFIINKFPENCFATEIIGCNFNGNKWNQHDTGSVQQKFFIEKSYASIVARISYFPGKSLNYKLKNGKQFLFDSDMIKRIATVNGKYCSHDERILSILPILTHVQTVTAPIIYMGITTDGYYPKSDPASLSREFNRFTDADLLNNNFNAEFPELINITKNSTKTIYLRNQDCLIFNNIFNLIKKNSPYKIVIDLSDCTNSFIALLKNR